MTEQITREPLHRDDTELGAPDTAGADYTLAVDGQRIGGTYWCGADTVPDGRRWASYGPAGLSMHHASREEAEGAQVAAYRFDPDRPRRYRVVNERERVQDAARSAAVRTFRFIDGRGDELRRGDLLTLANYAHAATVSTGVTGPIPVTDAMTDAAYGALPERLGEEIDYDQMRAALTAALDTWEKEENR